MRRGSTVPKQHQALPDDVRNSSTDGQVPCFSGHLFLIWENQQVGLAPTGISKAESRQVQPSTDAGQAETVGKCVHKAVFKEHYLPPPPQQLWLLPQGHVGHPGQTDCPIFNSYQEPDLKKKKKVNSSTPGRTKSPQREGTEALFHPDFQLKAVRKMIADDNIGLLS